jgi:hypothetical protein
MMSDLPRRLLRSEAYIDWVGVTYRILYYGLVSAPIWGTVLAIAIVWDSHPL